MVRVLQSSGVDHGFQSRPGQTKDYRFSFSSFSAKYAVLRKTGKTGWLGIIMYPGVATGVSADW